MKAVICHGTLGSPSGNWFPWLRDILIEKGWDVSVPTLPTPDNQTIDGWITTLKNQKVALDDVDIIIGHSLGATFILRLLGLGLINPQKTILVSGLIGEINNAEYDQLNAPFINSPYGWSDIRRASQNFVLLHGDNDPYVPLKQAEEIAKNLNIPLYAIKDGGHLNAEAGYREFPEILEHLND